MQICEKLTGHRFLRGVNVIGGVTKDISTEAAQQLLKDLEKIREDFDEVVAVAEGSASLFNRLKNTGILNRKIADDHGVVGVPGRAVGIEKDARIDYPYAAYDKMKFDMALEEAGDVCARFYVRLKEIYSSMEIIKQAFELMPKGELISSQKLALKKNYYALGITEGWRGEIVYFVATDSEGNIARVEPWDPSFINWNVLGHSGKGNIVPDFPLINKSYNLSYSGYDL